MMGDQGNMTNKRGSYRTETVCFYVCETCNLRFENVAGIERHVDECHGNTGDSNEDAATLEEDGRIKENHHGTSSKEIIDQHDDESRDELACEPIENSVFEDDNFTCSACATTYSTSSGFLKHMKTKHPTESPKYKCKICAYATHFPYTLYLHMSTHTKEKPFMCSQCPTGYKTKQALKVHGESHRIDGSQYKCDTCSFTTCDKQYLKKHVYVHTNEKPFACDTCGKPFKLKKNMNYHMKLKHPTEALPNFKCNICDYVCYSKYRMNDHMTSHNDKRTFVCKECGVTYKRKNSLNSHIRSKHKLIPKKPVEEYTCSVCHHSYRGKSRLNQHILSHSNDKLFVCETCGSSFKYKLALQSHTRCSHPVNPAQYLCPMCPYATHMKKRLKVHMVHHSDDRCFLCSHCQFPFKTKNALGGHVRRMHSGLAPPHKCTLCSYATHTPSGLNEHMGKHTVDRPFKCNMCDATYKTKRSVTRHHQSSHTDKRYLCEECGKSFKSSTALKKHKKLEMSGAV